MHAGTLLIHAVATHGRRGRLARMLLCVAALASATLAHAATVQRYALSGATAQLLPDAPPPGARHLMIANAHVEPLQATTDRRYDVRGAAAVKGFDPCIASAIFKDGFEGP